MKINSAEHNSTSCDSLPPELEQSQIQRKLMLTQSNQGIKLNVISYCFLPQECMVTLGCSNELLPMCTPCCNNLCEEQPCHTLTGLNPVLNTMLT